MFLDLRAWLDLGPALESQQTKDGATQVSTMEELINEGGPSRPGRLKRKGMLSLEDTMLSAHDQPVTGGHTLGGPTVRGTPRSQMHGRNVERGGGAGARVGGAWASWGRSVRLRKKETRTEGGAGCTAAGTGSLPLNGTLDAVTMEHFTLHVSYNVQNTERKWEKPQSWPRASFQGDENVLELDRGGGHTASGMRWMPLTRSL